MLEETERLEGSAKQIGLKINTTKNKIKWINAAQQEPIIINMEWKGSRILSICVQQFQGGGMEDI